MTTIYFMRHSEPLKPINLNNNNNNSLQVQNEKWGLTIKGEELAKEKSKNEEFSDFDIVISSNYVRAISTAKYFTQDNVLVDENFGERKFGISSWDELPENFGEKQLKDFDLKMPNGESINEVIDREYASLMKILNEYPNKKILIVGHATAGSCLFSKWCKLDSENNITFNGRPFFNGKWGHLETFKLIFDDNNDLISIENIK